METVTPRNNPGDQAITQDQEIKKPVFMSTAENAEGNESGTTTLISGGDHTVPYSGNDVGLNITASSENRSAQFKHGEGASPWSPGAYGNNQYQ